MSTTDTATTANTSTAPVSSLGMTDEEFMALDPSTWLGMEGSTENTEPVEGQETNPETEEAVARSAEADDDEGVEDEATTEDQNQEGNTPGSDLDGSDSVSEGDGDGQEGTEHEADDASSSDDQTDPTSPQETESQPIDYKAEYERLLAPFKANGRDIAVQSVDDAIALMQMGANYNKKMAALKPNLRVLKLLENNGLLSEDKLGFLIDLEKKNPDAINKLVKDSGIDPMDLDAEKAGEYVPRTYTVDERELELDSVLEDIQNSPTYTRTIETVGTHWDDKSRRTIAETPQLLRVLNDHMQRGVFDLITGEMERERMFGRLSGLSDIEAYRQVGEAIQTRGGFDHLGRQGHQPTTKTVKASSHPKQGDDSKLREKRKAASSTKPAAPSTTTKNFNPLALSDEDFGKLVNENYL